MDYLRRLMRLTLWFAIGIAFAYASMVPAYAQQTVPAIPVEGGAREFRLCVNETEYIRATPQETCSAWRAAFLANQQAAGNDPVFWYNDSEATGCNGTLSSVYGSCGTCTLKNTHGSWTSQPICGKASASYTCPPGYNGPDANNQCTRTVCPEGQILPIGATSCRCPRDSGEGFIAGGASSAWTGPTPPSPWCINGCAYQPGEIVCATVAGVRNCYTSGNVPTGATCTPSGPAPQPEPAPPPADPELPPEQRCLARGQGYGFVNGEVRCVPLGSNPEQGERCSNSTSSTTANGVRTDTTTRACTTCSNGQCSTTTTTSSTNTPVDASGTPTGPTTPGGTSSTTQPGNGNGNGNGTGTGAGPGEQDPFCRTNPNDPSCLRSAFSGACAAGFTCDGDAIQCAIAREQHRRNCQILEDRGALSKDRALDAVADVAANSGTGPNFIPRREVEAPTVNTAARLNGGACPSPQSINTPIGAITVDLTNLCEPMRWFGLIIVGAALLVAARIIIGGI